MIEANELQSFESFRDQMIDQLSKALEIPIEVLTMEFNREDTLSRRYKVLTDEINKNRLNVMAEYWVMHFNDDI